MPVNLIVKIMPISEKRVLSKKQTSKKFRTKKLIMKCYGIVLKVLLYMWGSSEAFIIKAISQEEWV